MFTFRKAPDGTIIALDNGRVEGKGLILSYEHIGQHSPASVDLLTEWEKPSWAEVLPLYNELLAVGYSYELPEIFDDF
jgi:hypothetical protein